MNGPSAARSGESRTGRAGPGGKDATAVAVVGMGLVVPGAESPEEFWTVLHGDRDAFTEPDHLALGNWYSPDERAEDKSYVRAAGYPRRIPLHPDDRERAPRLDRTALLLRHALRQALDGVARAPAGREAAFVGLPPGSLALEEATLCAVADAACPAGAVLRACLAGRYPHAPATPRRAFADLVLADACEGLLAAGGEVRAVDSACSSSLYAVDLAVKELLAGERDLVVCGGANTGPRRDLVLFSKARGFTRRGEVRAFDADADGVLFSDSAAALVLKRLAPARADGDRILGLLGGFGASVDGAGSLVASDPAGQKLAVARARAVGGTAARDVDWIVGHGTGTVVGDSVELEGLAELADESDQLITSNKSLVGHGAWAAGAISVIHVLLALRHGSIPGQRRFAGFPDGVEAGRLTVPLSDVRWAPSAGRVRTAGVCGYGLGGGNAHLIVHGPEAAAAGEAPSPASTTAPLSADPADGDDPVVLTAWSAHLPGEPDPDAVMDWLTGRGPAPEASFGEDYPLPPFPRLRMAPVTARSTDRTHLMAISVTERFAEEHGELWAAHRDTTGVFVAHTGPTRSMTDYTVRVAADDLLDAAARLPAQEREQLRGYLDRLRARLPAANDASMPGQLTNMIGCQIANRHRLHGLVLALDHGRSSAQAAVHTARRYLAAGELDLALVIAAAGHTGPLAEALTGAAPGTLGEGAVLLALTHKSLAVRQGWPVLARIRTGAAGDAMGEGAYAGAGPVPGGRDYQGAEGALALLRGLGPGPGQAGAEVHGVEGGPRVVLLPDEAVVAAPPDPGGPPGAQAAPATAPTRPPTATVRPAERETTEPAAPVARCVVAYRRQDAVPARVRPEGGDGIPYGALVLVDDTALARELAPAARAGAARILVTDPTATADETTGPPVLAPCREEPALAATARSTAPPCRDVLVVASAGRPADTWPAPPPPRLLRLQESLLLALRHLAPDATDSVTALLLDPLRGHTVHPHLTLVTGFLRSLALEMPCAVHAVVTDAAVDAGLAQLRQERAARRDHVVVRYRQGLRYVEQVCPAPLPPARAGAPLALDRNSVVVATGGARGATAVTVAALAARLAPRIWLLGTTPADDVPEDLLNTPDERLPEARRNHLRRALADAGRPVADLNRHFDTLLRAREIRLTLRRLRALCGEDRVHYVVCDLRDRAQVTAAARRITEQEGRVDLLVHGAGLLRSARVRDKTLQDFRAVRDTKILGYHHLKEAFADPAPRLWCSFGSAGGLTGFAGDTDYAAANEYLSAAAQAAHPGATEEFTLGWGLWGETGTVRERSRDIARRSGLPALSNEEGAAAFLAELTTPRPAHPAPFLGLPPGWTGSLGPATPATSPPPRRAPAPAAAPRSQPHGGLLGQPAALGPDGARWNWRPQPDRDTYLAEHLVDGRPLMPAAMMLALAAEAAVQLVPGAPVSILRDLTIDQPLYTDPARATVRCRITAVPQQPAPAGERGGTVRVEIRSDLCTRNGGPLQRDRLHARVDVVLAARSRPPEARPPGPLPRMEECPATRPDSSVQLSGVWRTNLHPEAGRTSARALWVPAFPPGSVFARLAVPALLIDATLRLFRYPPEATGCQVTGVPLAVDRIDLYTGADDVQLARAHPEGLRLWFRAADDRALAATADGAVQLAVTGMRMEVTGRLPARVRYQGWRP
ncbi:SDR family NAD(P)-dependent oxidoreductase [Kitasatospora sp. NPDC097605]|uniref:SDR family NAD(P)-dependent oxidoreductase n=1 Tax=Kitasatospora sp. NPDC097605 TaxID=3157226 RepID=UPI00332883D6